MPLPPHAAPPPAPPPAPLAEPESVATLVGRLVDDSRSLVSAEVALYRARAVERMTAYRNAAIFFGAAGVLALAGLIALLVGLIATLATLVGPGLATLVVVGIVFAIAIVLALVGKSRLAGPGGTA